MNGGVVNDIPLVNNVGKSHAMPAYLVDTDIVSIDVNATLQIQEERVDLEYRLLCRLLKTTA